MIHRRLFLASSAALLTVPRLSRADVMGLELSGNLQQGALVIGRSTPGATAKIDGAAIDVSPQGVFAFGFAYDQTKPTHIEVDHPDGGIETHDVTPQLRQYDIQRITGLPEKFVAPSPEEEARIHREHARLAQARTKDSDAVWFAEPFDWPANGIISGVFGSQRILNGVPSAPHFGVDIAGGEGAPIRAPANATVLMAEEFFLEGGFTLLDHGHGVFTEYLHQSQQLVKPGDIVTRGQQIGAIGKTGRATGPHLHWAMNWFQVRLDPSRSTATPAPPKS